MEIRGRLTLRDSLRLLAALAALALLAWAPPSSARGAQLGLTQSSPSAIAPLVAGPFQTPVLTMAKAVNDSLTPADYRSAYSLPKTGAADQTIAIVTAYDAPSVQTDLDDYTKRFGVPACTVADGCFRELDQNGSSSPLPAPDPSDGVFASEASVGVEVARGVCQSCKIVLVEANSASAADLSTSVMTAIDAGATEVVTTLIQPEAQGDSVYAPDFSGAHTVVLSASGDSAYTNQLNFPAALPNVLAVGGTQLALSASGQRLGETAWNLTTSGCSLYEQAPSWQSADANVVGCGTKRADADLSAAAAPGALVHIGDVGAPCGTSWCEADGTSVATPIIAGVIGLAGSAGNGEAGMLYRREKSNPGAFHDIIRGTTAVPCGSALCRARKGYDGPTGLGTPDGLAAFLRSGGALSHQRAGLTITSPRHTLQVSSRWTTALTLHNDNPFAVSGTIALRSTVRIDGRSGTVAFASSRLQLGPLATGPERFTIAPAQRSLLTRLHSAQVTVALQITGPAGPAVSASLDRRLAAP
jgi:hypothetical protein